MSRLTKTLRSYPKSFWIANSMELFERWAYYGLFAVLAIYLTGSRDTGALGFTQMQKGTLMGTFGLIVYLLPVLTGAIADKVGYKKILFIAYIVLFSGYFLLGQFSTYTVVFVVAIYVAVGAALFKPIISATIAKATNKETAAIGFGIFYMIVNIGGFIGPIFASIYREISWNYVFIISSLAIAFNILLLFFFKEPERASNTESIGKTIFSVFRNIGIVLSDLKFVLFLILITVFWIVYLQLFYTLPNFIDQWMDTNIIYNSIASFAPKLAAIVGTKEGIINPEMILNLVAFYIILFQIIVSSIVMKTKPINSIITGILICSIGIGLWSLTQNSFYLILSMFVFAIGEMVGSPRITEYFGRIAPKDKVALYMGVSFLPLAGGNFLAGILSGKVYGTMADKVTILKQEVAVRGLNIPEISENFTQNDYINKACNLMGFNQQTLTNFLWDNYNPSKIWYIFAGLGLFAGIGLFLYNRFILESKK